MRAYLANVLCQDSEIGAQNTLLFTQPGYIGVVTASAKGANCLSVLLYKPEQGLSLHKSYTLRWTSAWSHKILSLGQRFNWMAPAKGDDTVFELVGIPKSGAGFNVCICLRM